MILLAVTCQLQVSLILALEETVVVCWQKKSFPASHILGAPKQRILWSFVVWLVTLNSK